MAFTVALKGAGTPVIDDCEDSGTFTGLNVGDTTDFYKEGTQCCGFELWGSGNNDTYITGTWDFSTYTHIRWWMMTTVLNELNTDANGGIQVYMSDGSNTGYWYVSGSTTYPGGWWNPVLDTARDVDTGTKPTMSTITTIGFRFNLTTSAKKVESLWIDNITQTDGLKIYGNTASATVDFDDIYAADNATTLGAGVIRKIGGTFFVTGELEFTGDGTEGNLLLQALSQDVVFEDRPVASDLYGFNITDNGTQTTQFVLGDKVGTAGVQGCKVKVQDSSQTAKFYIDAKTDTDVDYFKLYGSTFYGAGTISFAADATNVEVLSCSFEACGQVDPNTAETRSCFFIDTSDTDAAVLWNESIDIQSCSFIGNTTGAGIEMPSSAGTPYDYTNLLFSGNTYDVYNSSGSAITINKLGTTNASSYEGSTVTFSASYPLSIYVQDKDKLPILNAQCSIHLEDSPYTELLNEDSASDGYALDSFSGTPPANIVWKVRKSATTDDPRYFARSDTGQITTDGFSITVTLEENPYI